ncbi:hypothetical protein J2S19_000711 [Metabacillus malikii]|uniref:Uncharacterized protein n=1 Tax=Metabacillus malikii TaxID=1504265 RepID=A0ABT9ZDZ2_9BACI|nr:hypothetical protein [Metabacillus malikii]
MVEKKYGTPDDRGKVRRGGLLRRRARKLEAPIGFLAKSMNDLMCTT